jgi:hypothetical protein
MRTVRCFLLVSNTVPRKKWGVSKHKKSAHIVTQIAVKVKNSPAAKYKVRVYPPLHFQ